MWSSTTTTSSTLPCHCLANIPIVAEPQPLFEDAVDDRRITGLHHHRGAAIDGEFDGLAIAQIHQRVAGDAPFLLRAAGEVMHAAQGQHLRAVLAGGDVTYCLALRA